VKKGQTISNAGRTSNPKGTIKNSSVVEVPAIQVAAEKGQPLVRGGITSGSPGQLVRYWNRWRENYNALVGLTMQRVRALLEQSQRGDMAYPQWTYRIIERRHPVLKSLLDCCESPMENFKWDIRIKKELPEGFTEDQAKIQQAALKSAYAQVDNVREGLVHLALADFRGYSHIQKHYLDGEVTHFECLFQYCLCRDGLFGDWFWNPDSKSLTMPEYVLTTANRIGSDQLPREDFIIREVERPIDEIALENFVRRKLIEKDWSAFDEIFGIPSGVVTMPANVPSGRESEYEQSAKMIAEGGSGAIPNGASYTANDMPRDGSNLFKNHIAQLDEDLVLAGTGGKLKMLVQQGPGEKRGSAKTQDDTFDEISRARGNKAAQALHQDFDIPFLTAKFPTQPALVEFCLVTEDETNVDSLCMNVATLKQAGKNVKTEWLADQTGYEFEDDDAEPDPNAQPEDGNPTEDAAPNPDSALRKNTPPIANRRSVKNRSDAGDMASSIHEALMPILNSLDAIRKIDDPELQRHAVEGLLKNMPHLETIILQNKTLANKLLPELVDALVSGLKPATK
jgi:phage gp29-like protein